MKLVLDEHVPRTVAQQLRQRGWDVVTARELWPGRDRSDAELLRQATDAGRAILTENVADFIELHRAAVVSGRHHRGLIFTSPRRFSRTKRAAGRLIAALDAFLRDHPANDALESQVAWLN